MTDVKNKRLFVGLAVPPSIAAAVAPLQNDLDSVLWIAAHNLHITLHFLGVVAPEDIPKLHETLAEPVAIPPLLLALQGVSFWEPRIVWAGVQAPDALYALKEEIDIRLTSLGYPCESRPYKPHVTIARVRSSSPPEHIASYLNHHIGFHTTAFTVTEFVLFESVALNGNGSNYVPLARFPLLTQP